MTNPHELNQTRRVDTSPYPPMAGGSPDVTLSLTPLVVDGTPIPDAIGQEPEKFEQAMAKLAELSGLDRKDITLRTFIFGKGDEVDNGLDSDSLDAVEAVMALEEVLGIEIDDEEAESLGRIGDVFYLYNLKKYGDPGKLDTWKMERQAAIAKYEEEHSRRNKFEAHSA